MMEWALLILGLVILVKGADMFVKGASNLAGIMKVSPLIIGLTIVAFGTSAPEAAVSILASIQRVEGIAFGNIAGSNLFNILIILGISAVVLPIKAEGSLLKKELPFLLLSSILMLVMVLWFKPGITRIEGGILLIGFGVFLYMVFLKSEEIHTEEVVVNTTLKKTVFLTIIGLIAIAIGGFLVSTYASALAIYYGLSEMFVGLTIVALGTSAPELTTSIVALIKKQKDIALGNIIGSNIFNTLFIAGMSSVIYPLTNLGNVTVDVVLIAVASLIVFIFTFTRKTLSRTEGIILIVIYIVYVFYILSRGGLL
ncbi:MAG: calcium/sodium antiporter [Bacillota bacterium]